MGFQLNKGVVLIKIIKWPLPLTPSPPPPPGRTRLSARKPLQNYHIDETL